MPLPDIVLTREPKGAGPIPLASVALIVEVSASTLKRDMHDKLAIYARALVPEYWIVDVDSRVIHQMWAAAEQGYGQRREFKFGTLISAATIDQLIVTTDDL